jgi:CelD/BcsL family acetyltransferase involved in cellulose biosynthesis
LVRREITWNDRSPASRPAGELELSVVTTAAEWDAVGEEPWDALLARTGRGNPFLTWAWLRSWWTHYSPRLSGASLHILLLRSGRRLVGAAPLYRQRVSGYGAGSLPRLGFIGDASGDSDYLDFVIEPGMEAAAIEAFLDHFEASDCRILQLRSVPDSSPNLAILRESAAQRSYLTAVAETACLSVPLPAEWDAYLRALQPRFRGRLRSLLRRLPAEHEGEFGVCTDPGELATELPRMFELHGKRWRRAGEPGVFSEPLRRAFYHDMARRFLDRGRLRLYRLRLKDRAVAYEFCLEHEGRVYWLQHAADPACAPLSVGTAVKAHAIRGSIERGAAAYDLLAGAENHQLRWGPQQRIAVDLSLGLPGLRTRWRFWFPPFLERLRDGGRMLAPQPVLRLKRGIQRRVQEARLPAGEA